MGENGTLLGNAICFRAQQLIQEWRELDDERRCGAVAGLAGTLARLANSDLVCAIALAAHDSPDLA